MKRSILLVAMVLLATGAVAEPLLISQEQQLEQIRQNQAAQFHQDMERRLDAILEQSLGSPTVQSDALLLENLISSQSVDDLLLQANSK